MSKLTQKVIIDRNGHRKTICVSFGAPEKKDSMVGKGISETDHEKGLTDRELKNECFQYAKDNFQSKKFKNTDTGRDIIVSSDGLNKWYNKTKSREQSISVKELDKILVESKKTGSDTDRKKRDFVEGYTYFNYEMDINKKPFRVSMMTREIKNRGSKYYYHYLEDIKIEPDSGLA